ncbi:nucleoside diphosphate kinase [Powellomyces hirtus]|nr:nucleoside diphosphate kinase [Powellomyces hirtus]
MLRFLLLLLSLPLLAFHLYADPPTQLCRWLTTTELDTVFLRTQDWVLFDRCNRKLRYIDKQRPPSAASPDAVAHSTATAHSDTTQSQTTFPPPEKSVDCIPCFTPSDSSSPPTQEEHQFSDSMSAHARKIEIVGTAAVSTDEEWEAQISRPCLTVVDVYARWAGPCEPMQNIFKRLKLDYGEAVNFVMAQTDGIEALATLRNKSCPTFLFFFKGTLVKMIKGANAPQIEKTIKEQLDLEKKGLPHVALRLDNLSLAVSTSGDSAAASQDDSSSPMTPYTPMSATSERTLAIIKPDAMAPAVLAQILDIIRRNRFDIVQRKKVWLTPAQVEELYKEHEKAAYFQGVLTHMSTAPVLALILNKDNAVQDWRKVMGPANSRAARDAAPSSIRALVGTDNRLNAVYGSETLEAAGHEIELLFGANASVLELPLPAIVDQPSSALIQPPEKTLAIIKPDMIDPEKVDAIVERIVCRGYQVLKRESVHLSQDEAAELYSHQKEAPYFADAVAFMSSGPVVALVLKGSDVVNGWREMIGPTDPETAKSQFPMSIRARFGTDAVRNAVHGSDGIANAHREIRQLFPSLLMRSESGVYGTRPSTASMHDTPTTHHTASADDNILTERTCALIKPDAFAKGHKDEIVQKIKAAGFKIVAEKEVELKREQALEFYKEHNGQGFFEELVNWMSTPDLPIYAMVLERDTAITAWRELAGPTNSNKAREIAPNSIRALFGTDGSKNAVHGSDSPQSAEREIKIIFGDSVSPYPSAAKPTASTSTQRTLALIKPDAYGAGKKDEIVKRIKDDGFRIVEQAETMWSKEKAAEFYREHVGKGFYDELVRWMSSAPIYAMVLEKDDGIKGWRDLAGPTNSEKARESAPNSIRALFGTDGSRNAVHGSDSPASASREISLVFPSTDSSARIPAPAAKSPERTLALIKPDATAQRDAIISRIKSAGFTIVKQEEITLTPEKAGEFYREHASRPFYETLVTWMSSESILALVLEKVDAVVEWRELAGPTDSNKARTSVPNSIRALYGTDGSKNAVHGSDSLPSAEREIRLIFPDLAGSHHAAQHASATSSGVPIQRTLALIKPDVYPAKKPDIVKRIQADGFTIVTEKEVNFSSEVAKMFYKEHEGKGFYDDLVEWMSSAPIYALVLEKEGAITGWRELAGPTNSEKARESAPQSIRAVYGTDGSKNAVHGSDSEPSAEREIRLVFGDAVSPFATAQGTRAAAPSHQSKPTPASTTATTPGPAAVTNDDPRHLERTLALIKPDAYGTHKAEIIRRVQEAGFVIIKESELRFTPEMAAAFYQEHNGKPFYDTLVEWMSSKPIYAMVLEAEDAVKKWRGLAGPTNSEKARETDPNSIRALFGTDGSQNAVHGSDSVSSATREIGIVFGDSLPAPPPTTTQVAPATTTTTTSATPKPPTTAKPASSSPSRAASSSNVAAARKSTSNLTSSSRATSQKSVAPTATTTGSKPASRVSSSTALASAKSASSVNKPGSRVASKNDLSSSKVRSPSTGMGLRASTNKLAADKNAGATGVGTAEPVGPTAAIMDDPTNIVAKEE